MSGYTSSLRQVAKIALAGVVVGMGALAAATQANAQPAPPLPPPVPGEAPPPGQPVAVDPGAQPVAAPAPPPVGPPPVPQIANQQYGQGSTSGRLGFLRDAWQMAQDPQNFTGTMQPGDVPAAAPPPPGAGPAPQLPPGYQSLTDPASSGPVPERNYAGGPPLPEGYYPLTGPPPPGYFDAPPAPDSIAPVNPGALPPSGPIPVTP
ncbi:hypothetical protein [Mycobacterium neglectum]|jgi:hypothetical protein|uniref:hypothetical protein n=1 Tax=Mycobacterium neglectum TaxID=242737 RepID=UPI000BFEE7E9|nr:hypothetical protein [Mycobacterium neglectum]